MIKMENYRSNFIGQPLVGTVKKVDVLFFVFLALTTVLLLLSWKQSSDPLGLLYVRMAILVTVVGLVYLNTIARWPFLNLIRNTYPIILSGYFYSETVHYNKYFLDNMDPLLESLEFYLFGTQPSVSFSSRFSNLLFSELMYFGYFSFYLLILGFTLYLLFKKREFAQKGIFLLSASLYIFYFFFGLVPSEGPQFYFPLPDRALPEAYVFDKIMHFIQHSAEQPTGAFPSSHVGISLIILMLSWKRMPVFFRIALPLTIILGLSTVYIKAHYVLDVLGAMVVAPFILYLSHVLYSLPFKKYTALSNNKKGA